MASNIIFLSIIFSIIVFYLGKTHLGFFQKILLTISICFMILTWRNWTDESRLRSLRSIPQTNLLNQISKIAEDNGIKSENIYIGHLNNFTYSPINAQTLYVNLNKSIVLSDALFSKNSELALTDEGIISLMYHEISHYKNNDVLKIHLLNYIMLSISLVFLLFLQNKVIKFKFTENNSINIITIFFINTTLLILMISISTLITRKQQRIMEYNADLYSLSLYPNRKAFSELIEKSNYGKNGLTDSAVDRLFSTHPSKYDRLSLAKNNGRAK